jgi:hypothetical protein
VKTCFWGSFLALVLGPDLGPKTVSKTMSPNSWGTSFSTLFLGRNLGPKSVPRNHTADETEIVTPMDQHSVSYLMLNQNSRPPWDTNGASNRLTALVEQTMVWHHVSGTHCLLFKANDEAGQKAHCSTLDSTHVDDHLPWIMDLGGTCEKIPCL